MAGVTLQKNSEKKFFFSFSTDIFDKLPHAFEVTEFFVQAFDSWINCMRSHCQELNSNSLVN